MSMVEDAGSSSVQHPTPVTRPDGSPSSAVQEFGLSAEPASAVPVDAVPPSSKYFDVVVRYPWCVCIFYLFLFIASMGCSILAYGLPVLEMAFVGLETRGDGLAFGEIFARSLKRQLDAGTMNRSQVPQNWEVPTLSSRFGIDESSSMILWFEMEDLLTPDSVQRICEVGLTLRQKCVDHSKCYVCPNCNTTLFTIAGAIDTFFPQQPSTDHPANCDVAPETLDKFVSLMNTCYDPTQRQNATLCQSEEAWNQIFSYAVPRTWKPNSAVRETTVVLALASEVAGESPHVHSLELYTDIIEPIVDTHSIQGASVYSIFGKGEVFLWFVIFELLFAILATVLVFCLVWWHTKSLFVTLGGFVAMLVSLCGSGFIYHLTVPFWPFLNLLMVFVLIAIGVDDIFVYMDTWNLSFTAIPPKTPLANRVAWTTRRAASSMAVTTITDGASFAANVVSPVTALRVFGIFSGLAILFNYLLLILILPCLVSIISEGWVAILGQKVWQRLHIPCLGASTTHERRIDHFFANILGALVYKLRLPLAIFFFACGIGLIPVALMFSHSEAPRNVLFVDDHPLEQWDLAGHSHFEFSWATSQLVVSVIFGVSNNDNGNKFTPVHDEPRFSAAYPTLEFLPLDIPAAETHFDRLCNEARNQTWFFPTATCVRDIFTLPDDPQPKILILRIPTKLLADGPFSEQARVIEEIDTWIQPLLDCPSGMEGWWYPYGFHSYTLKKGLADGVPVAMGISISLAFLVLLVTSWNIVASFLATLTVAFSVLTVVACMVAAGWSLDIIESIILSLSVGFTVDFACHLSHAYVRAPVGENPEREREIRVRFAAGTLGVSVSMAALTTFLAGCVMVPTVARNYHYFGIYLISVMSVSWGYAFFFFLPAMGILGTVSRGASTDV